MSEDTRSVTLFIQRDGGTLGQATIRFATREAQNDDDLTVGIAEGVAAVEGVDYIYRDGSIEFEIGEVVCHILVSVQLSEYCYSYCGVLDPEGHHHSTRSTNQQ